MPGSSWEGLQTENLNVGQVSNVTSATAIVPKRSSRKRLTIVASVDAYVGSTNSVSTTTGLYCPAKVPIVLNYNGPLYAAAASASVISFSEEY